MNKITNYTLPNKIHWNWEITHNCNYKCSYCYTWRDENKIDMPYVDLVIWKKIWDRIFLNYGCTHIRFSGGEPTIYPDFFELIKILSEKHTIDITTNLSFDIHIFIDKVKPNGLMLSPSYHYEYDNFKNFLNKAIFLRDRGYFLSGICFVAYPKYLDKLKLYKKLTEDNKFDFKLIPFNGRIGNKIYPRDYSDSEREILQLLANDSLAKDLNKKWYEWNVDKKDIEISKDKLCYMGQMYAKISPNGIVRRCCAPDVEIIGNIFDDNFRLFNSPLPCISNKCPCFKAMLVGQEEE